MNDLLLNELCKGDLELANILKKGLEATSIYSTAVIYNGNGNTKKHIGSGTFVIYTGKKGILTNHHVAKIFMQTTCAYVEIPLTNESCLRLPIKSIISLPSSDSPQESASDCIDIALIVLDEDICKGLMELVNKKFINLDEAREKYKINTKFHSEGKGFWIIRGNVIEGAKKINNDKTIYLENANPYLVFPNLKEIQEKNYSNKSINVKFDLLSCPMGVADRSLLPEKFNGMSGAALWRVGIHEGGIKIIVVGVQASQLKDFDKEELVCRGPLTLYDSFYKYCENIYFPK